MFPLISSVVAPRFQITIDNLEYSNLSKMYISKEMFDLNKDGFNVYDKYICKFFVIINVQKSKNRRLPVSWWTSKVLRFRYHRFLGFKIWKIGKSLWINLHFKINKFVMEEICTIGNHTMNHIHPILFIQVLGQPIV